MSRTMRCLSTAGICAFVFLLGACTAPDDAPTPSTATAPSRAASLDLGPWSVTAAGGDELLHQALLTHADVASAIGASTTVVREMPWSEASELSGGLTASFGVPVEGCAEAVDPRRSSGSRGVWKAGAFYRILHGDRHGDVVQCITTADMQAIEDLMPAGGARYTPAPIGGRVTGVEADGGGGAIDRAVLVEDDGVLILVVANLHSPVPAGQNLTRAQVDRLVAAAAGKVDIAGWIGQLRGDRHRGAFPGSGSPRAG